MPALADSDPHRAAVAITLTATLLTSVAYAPDPAHDATHEEGVVYVHTVVDHGDGPVTTCEGRRPEEPPRLILAEAD